MVLRSQSMETGNHYELAVEHSTLLQNRISVVSKWNMSDAWVQLFFNFEVLLFIITNSVSNIQLC